LLYICSSKQLKHFAYDKIKFYCAKQCTKKYIKSVSYYSGSWNFTTFETTKSKSANAHVNWRGH